jgi:hypothetical protein
MRFRSPLLSQSRFLSFPPGTEMVHFPGFARARLWIHRAVRRVHLRGFPHSEIPGSKPACGSPRLIAACHVLHRLLLPRHPPCALSSLTTKFTQHTQDRLRLSAISFQSKTLPNTPLKFYGPLLLLIARLTPINVYAHQQLLSGTHKNLQRLVFAQSIQLSNIVLISLLVYSCADLPRVGGYGSCSVRGVQTPHCIQPNVRRQSDFHEP